MRLLTCSKMAKQLMLFPVLFPVWKRYIVDFWGRECRFKLEAK